MANDGPSEEDLEELYDLAADVLHGTAGEADRARLEERLLADPGARRAYLRYALLHAELSLNVAAVEHGSDPVVRDDPSSGDPFDGLAGLRPGQGGIRRRRVWSWLPWTVAVAACVLASLTSGLIGKRPAVEAPGRGGASPTSTMRPPVPRPRQGPMVVDARAQVQVQPQALALVVKLDGVRWEPDGGPAVSEGAPLTANRLRLRSGRVALALLNGVMLTLEGPGDLELVALDRVFCHRGKLRARVPHEAAGFVVLAPGTTVVDLGTEFALNVGDDGKARVKVFEGQAEAAVLGASGMPERSQRVGSSEVFEIDPETGDIRRAVADTSSYATTPALVAPALVLDASYPGAVLASRPWGYWRFEESADGATPNAIPGGPPLRATGAVRVAAASRGNGFAEFAAGDGVQLLRLDGHWRPPSDPGYAAELWFMTQEYNHSALVSLSSKREDDIYHHYALVELTTPAHYPYPKSASVRFLHRWPPGGTGGINIYNGVGYVPYRWHHLVAQRVADRIELYIDGVLARSRALKPDHPTATCEVLLGRMTTLEEDEVGQNRPFFGRMDEFALYERPLSAGEISRHFQRATQEAPPR